MDWYLSAGFGNSMGLLGVIIGFISLIIAVRTMNTAKSIKKIVDEAKKDTANLIEFKKKRQIMMRKISKSKSAIQRAGKTSWNKIGDIIYDLVTIIDDPILQKNDNEKIKEIYNRLKKLQIEKVKNSKDIDTVTALLECLAEIDGILNRGDYNL